MCSRNRFWIALTVLVENRALNSLTKTSESLRMNVFAQESFVSQVVSNENK